VHYISHAKSAGAFARRECRSRSGVQTGLSHELAARTPRERALPVDDRDGLCDPRLQASG